MKGFPFYQGGGKKRDSFSESHSPPSTVSNQSLPPFSLVCLEAKPRTDDRIQIFLGVLATEVYISLEPLRSSD